MSEKPEFLLAIGEDKKVILLEWPSHCFDFFLGLGAVLRLFILDKVINLILKIELIFLAGYVWWSLIHGIIAMIWFYPLNELEISGYEAFIVTILSPILTRTNILLRFSGTIHGLTFWRALSLVGIVSFQAPTTLIRLMMLSFGSGKAMLWFCGMIWSKDPKERWDKLIVQILFER